MHLFLERSITSHNVHSPGKRNNRWEDYLDHQSGTKVMSTHEVDTRLQPQLRTFYNLFSHLCRLTNKQSRTETCSETMVKNGAQNLLFTVKPRVFIIIVHILCPNTSLNQPMNSRDHRNCGRSRWFYISVFFSFIVHGVGIGVVLSVYLFSLLPHIYSGSDSSVTRMNHHHTAAKWLYLIYYNCYYKMKR